jgi:hypothetical protein
MQRLPSPDQTRRSDIAAHPIILADGNAWGFARPSLRLIPVVVTESDGFGLVRETIRIRTDYGYSLDMQCLLDDLTHALGDDTSECRPEAFFALAAALLCRAHSIDLSTATSLLAVNVADLPRIAHEIITVALGGILYSSDRPDEGLHGPG